MGIFTAKPKNNNIHIIYCLFSKKKLLKKKSKDKFPLLNKISKIQKNTKIEPNKVYKNNWYEAAILRDLLPHIPIKKNVGKIINSKNIKK